MTVRSVHGERLGHILALGQSQFCIEKGLFFRKGYFASYDTIKEVKDGEVILTLGRDRLLDDDRKPQSETSLEKRVVSEHRTVRVPRVDQEIDATPRLARPLSGRDLLGNDSPAPEESDSGDEAFAPTPVRPVKEGGALPPSPGPDGLWP